MPLLSQDDLTKCDYLRLLVLGYPKSGKSTTILLTCETPVHVINCDAKSGLQPARRLGCKFTYERVNGPDYLSQMETAIANCRRMVKGGEVKTVLLDGLNYHARHILGQLKEWSASRNKSGESDGRAYWPEYNTRLMNAVERLVDLDCHFIATSHYSQTGPEIEGQAKKSGDGVVPLIEGNVRLQIAGLFDDTIFMERTGDDRIFVLKTGGKFGPGGRNLSGVETCPADVTEYWKLCLENNTTVEASGTPAAVEKTANK